MLYVEIVTACIPGYVAAAIYARTKWHRIKHARTLANIARLERELFAPPVAPYVQGVEHAIKAAAYAKAGNYGTGIVGAAVQAQADMVSNFNQAVTSGRWANRLNV